MRAGLIGIVIVAALVCIFLLTYQFPAVPLRSIVAWVLVGAFAVALIGHYWMRRRHLREWATADGHIVSCRLGEMYRGAQAYYCVYMFSVDDARQAGELQMSDKPNRLEEIKAALVGQQVTVKYDPNDCTKSIIEETQINGWSFLS